MDNIAESLEKSLKAAAWVSTADSTAVATARRLARLLDDLIDSGESRDVAQLLARYVQLLSALRLTPESRSEQSKANDDQPQSLDAIQDSFARLVKPTNRVSKAKRAHPSAGGGATS